MKPLRLALFLTVAGILVTVAGIVAYYNVTQGLGNVLFAVGLFGAAAGVLLALVYGLVRFVKASARD